MNVIPIKIQDDDKKLSIIFNCFDKIENNCYIIKDNFINDKKGNVLVYKFSTLFYILQLIFFTIGIVGLFLQLKLIKDPLNSSEENLLFYNNNNNWYTTMIIGFLFFLIFYMVNFFINLFWFVLPLYELSKNKLTLNQYIDKLKNLKKSIFEIKFISYHYTTDVRSTSKVITNVETANLEINDMIDDTLPLNINHVYSYGTPSLFYIRFNYKWMPNDILSTERIGDIISEMTNKYRNLDKEFSINFKMTYCTDQTTSFPNDNISLDSGSFEIINKGLFLINPDQINNKEEEYLLGKSLSYEEIKSKIPLCLNWCTCLLCSFLPLTLPFQLYYKSNVLHSDFNFLKKINIPQSIELKTIQ